MTGETRTMTKIFYSAEDLAGLLDETRWAMDFSWPEICQISEQMHAFEAKKGAVLFDEGEIDQSMCIIVDGTVNIVKTGHKHDSNVIATISAPHSFGEMSLIDGEPRSAQVIAATDVLILSISQTNFFKLAEHAPPLALQLLWRISKLISQRLRTMSGQLVESLETQKP